MKLMKKLMILLVAVFMVASLTSRVYAEETDSGNNNDAGNEVVEPKKHTVSTESTTHTYEVYQIFTGEKSGNQLVNLKYGTNAKTGTPKTSVSAADMATLSAIEKKTYNNDQEKITDLTPFVNLTSPVAVLGKDGDKSASLEEGYYIIKDKDNSLSDPETYTLYLFKVLDDNLEITPKDGTTVVDKTVTETNDTTGVSTAEQKGADYDEGDSIPYSISITLAKNVTDYKKYEVALTDTLSEGLTPPATNDITVTIKGKNGTVIDGTSIAGYTAPVATVDGQKISVVFSAGNGTTAIGTAGAALNEAVITVTYNAVLNNKAKTGVEGNPNTYTINYSNNPNGNDKGTTPEKDVKVYTYELEIEKKDGNGNPLSGAEFTLYKVVTEAYPDAKRGSDIKKNLGSGVDASKLDDNTYYVPITMTETAGADKVTHKTNKKIDAGDYVLIETKIPAGYNAYAGENIKITSTIDKDGKLTDLTATPATLTVSSEKKLVSGAVVNESGATLPSTGGIGTTIFHIAGAALVLGAGILLISKKRMNNN